MSHQIKFVALSVIIENKPTLVLLQEASATG